MGVTKSDIFSAQQNHLADMLKALAHPARIAILQHIMAQKSCICGDLVQELGLAQATISQHLKALKAVRIIKGTIEGNSICYCIDTEVWQQIKTDMANFFTDFSLEKGCC